MSYGVLSGLRYYILAIANIKAMKKLHKNMFESLLMAPINNFFERVPVGRILNRFSEDMNICDN